MWKMNSTLEENFFNFAAERVWYTGKDGPQDTDEELAAITEQMTAVVDPKIWHKYETKVSNYNDQAMYEAYKQGFIDALLLFVSSKIG